MLLPKARRLHSRISGYNAAIKAILAVNLALGLFLLLWAAASDARTLGLASNINDELRSRSPDAQPLEFGDFVDLLSPAAKTDATVCNLVGGSLVATSLLGLWLNRRRPSPPASDREDGTTRTPERPLQWP